MPQIDPAILKPDLIAPCGMNCALCLAFQRSKNKCRGCREEHPDKVKTRELCIIRNCVTVQNNTSHFCYECTIMPCKRLKQLDRRYQTKYGMSMIDNLNEIKEDGIVSFIDHQKTKYTCNSCNGLICVHRSRCLNCNP